MCALHVQVAAADVPGVLKVHRRANHAPINSEPLPLSALGFVAALTLTPGAASLVGQAAGEPLDPDLAVVRHLDSSSSLSLSLDSPAVPAKLQTDQYNLKKILKLNII